MLSSRKVTPSKGSQRIIMKYFNPTDSRLQTPQRPKVFDRLHHKIPLIPRSEEKLRKSVRTQNNTPINQRRKFKDENEMARSAERLYSEGKKRNDKFRDLKKSQDEKFTQRSSSTNRESSLPMKELNNRLVLAALKKDFIEFL